MKQAPKRATKPTKPTEPTEAAPIKIEHGIPLPKPGSRAKRSPITLAMQAMRIGDSFLWSMQSGSIFTYAKHAGIKIATRKEGDGIRVWRVE